MSELPYAERAEPQGVRLAQCPVFRMEQHDQAYQIWRSAGVRERVLVHVDAHHDMWWVDRSNARTIANFVCLALKDGLLEQVFWVVPDATFERADGRRAVLHHLQRLRARYPSADRHAEDIDVGADRMSTSLLEKRLTVCSLATLPRIDVPVLLDLDVDFLVIPSVSYNEADVHAALPWLWPDQLLDRLSARGIRSDLVTVVYSVEGGYTPLRWKYLGDELAARLDALEAPLEAFERLRRGAQATARGDTVAATSAFRLAAELLPDSAAPYCHLAQAYLSAGSTREAQDAHQHMVASDVTYRTPYNNDGLSLYAARRYSDAEKEWHRALELDASDAYAHLGLARLAARRKQWAVAGASAQEALRCDGDLVDGHRLLGRALAGQRRYDEAIHAFESSLKLTHAGKRSIAATPLSGSEGRPIDPDYFVVFARLGQLYGAKGDTAAAIENYRMALAGKCDGLQIRLDLARIYLRQGLFARGVREAWKGMQLLPDEIRGRWRRMVTA